MVKTILIDARLYGLENSGIGRYLIHLIDELVNIDNNNKYIILLKKKYFYDLKLNNNFRKIIADYKHYSLLEQIITPLIISKVKPDIVHFPHFNIPILYNGNFVVTIHDMTMHWKNTKASNLPIFGYYFKRIPYKYVFRKAVNNSKIIICPSNKVKNDIIEYYNIKGEKIKIIYESYCEVYENNRKNKENKKYSNIKYEYFIYTGNVYPHKNIERLIEAIVFLNENINKKAKLLLAGSRSIFEKRLSLYIKKNSAEKYIETLGFVSDEELKYLYKNSIAFVYPSLNEGFGLQGLEAMASGTLVLASDIEVFREVYKDYAKYFNPFDSKKIAFAMKDAIEVREGVRLERIKKAKKFIKSYSWKKMAKETLDVYKECF